MSVHRIGLVVPSSNVTVEAEIPALLRRHPASEFTFHATRMRMHSVTAAELAAMNAQRERCVLEIADASPAAILYGCLVAVMVGGAGEHTRVEGAIAEQLAAGSSEAIIRSSAGALVEALGDLGAKRIALVMPYMRPLAEKVVAYLESEGFTVADWAALEVADNTAVGCIRGDDVMAAARSLSLDGVDALVLSCCVQMPSLDLIEPAEAELGLPVLSAATAGAYSLLRGLGLATAIEGAGSLLRADVSTVPA